MALGKSMLSSFSALHLVGRRHMRINNACKCLSALNAAPALYIMILGEHVSGSNVTTARTRANERNGLGGFLLLLNCSNAQALLERADALPDGFGCLGLIALYG